MLRPQSRTESGTDSSTDVLHALTLATIDCARPQVNVLEGETVGDDGSRRTEIEVSDDPYDSRPLMAVSAEGTTVNHHRHDDSTRSP